MVRTNKKKQKGRKNNNNNQFRKENVAAARAVAAYMEEAPTVIDETSETFSIYGREVPMDVYNIARNHAFARIIKDNGIGIPSDMIADAEPKTLTLTDGFVVQIYHSAHNGCYESAIEFYQNQIDYPEFDYSRMNAHCAQQFAHKVAMDIADMYHHNMVTLAVKEKHNDNTANKASNDDGGEMKKPAAIKDFQKNATEGIDTSSTPKINRTTFLLFSLHIRPIVEEENPEASFDNVDRIIYAKYYALDTNERKEWDEKAAADKIRYQLEMEEYNARHHDDNDDKEEEEEEEEKKPVAADHAIITDNDTSSLLLVRNIAPHIKDADLGQAFGRIGKVRDVYIPRDVHSQQPKGFAFINYANPEREFFSFVTENTVSEATRISFSYFVSDLIFNYPFPPFFISLNCEEARKARDAMNGLRIQECELKVMFAQEPMKNITKDEIDIEQLFMNHGLDFFDEVKQRCLSVKSLTTLIVNENNDGSCLHYNTSGRYHISRALEIILALHYAAEYLDTTVPPSLIVEMERLAGISLDDATGDPEFSQFLFSTVTNVCIDRDEACTNEGSYFCRIFLLKAVGIKHTQQLENAITNNGEKLHDGIRHLYNQKLLKYKRDIKSYRGCINMCYRETKGFCHCMKPFRLECKTWVKEEKCHGCKEVVPKEEMQYCSGCLFNVYCSYECSIKGWVEGNHKYHCDRKNYIRCSTCRVIFPSNELSIHKCIFDHDVTL